MKISSIFSTRNVTLLAFILIVLFLGTAFNVKVGPESFSLFGNSFPEGQRWNGNACVK